MSSIIEPHHRRLVAKIPRDQHESYLLEFIALYVLQNGSAGLISRFPELAELWQDPPIGSQSPAVAAAFHVGERGIRESEHFAAHARATAGIEQSPDEPPRIMRNANFHQGAG